ncbi:hypothetical protein M406DRAFT_354420 [Cryphonectria parasitica EP155]|uniref:Uncharacterized protein n=1 Tax=Cryphonectria parasitica (strain ATCC 38755 / EP155) TaxID=660469 RepID=A0A9P5CUF4_CRYP1|nr:uncharacterized protein M406DRAFT_354420 [Cryphonectria parasitica EP155]KAF3770376.1 hypothetical protein M406DRAFT_354420 [Cryphonectria parasitica EP155]
MGSSKRAPPPAPLYTTDPTHGQMMASPTSYESQTPRTVGAGPSSSPRHCPRTDSMDSNVSTSSTASHQNRKVSTPRNVYTHCGRHSDQYLFGGWGDVVKNVFHHRKN